MNSVAAAQTNSQQLAGNGACSRGASSCGVVDRGRADVGHDTVENDVVEVAVVGDAGEAPIVQETLEASIERPLHIHRAGVGGYLLLELANELASRHGIDEACRRIGVADMDELEEGRRTHRLMNTITAVAHILSCHEQLAKTRVDALAAADVLDGAQADHAHKLAEEIGAALGMCHQLLEELGGEY